MSAARREHRRPTADRPHGGRARGNPTSVGAEPTARAARPGDRGATIAAVALVLAVLGTAILVDVRAEAAFDAPKRLVALLGIVVAAASLAWEAGVPRTAVSRLVPTGSNVLAGARAASTTRRVIAIALGVAAFGTVVATLASPRPAIARDALRALVLFAVAVPLGASRALDDGRSRWVLAAFVVGAVVNALGSLAQASGVALFTTALVTGRTDTGAFLGNEGHLAQVAALALVAAGVAAWRGTSAAVRAAAAAACAVLVTALVVNRNLTALVTAGAGGAIVVLLARGRRGLVPLAVAIVVLGVVVLAYAPMRARLGEAIQAARVGDWDALTTNRLGPWSAAVEMTRARPLTGFGPGTFGAEFASHRLTAEIHQRRRFVIPLLTSSFAETHSDYLQAAAEGGIATALACVVAAVALLAGLVPLARRPTDDRSTEALVVVALLGATALAALTWFPLQIPAVMLPMLLAAGRGWRLIAPAAAEPASAAGVRRADGGTQRSAAAGREVEVATDAAAAQASRPALRVLALAAVGVMVASFAPELRRHAAERRLARVVATVESVVAGGRLVPEAHDRLAALAATASADAAAIPADTRGLVAAGTAMLVAGDVGEARGHYRAALARGERAEIDLNLARAYAVEGRRDDAEAALLRAAWLSPALLAALPSADRSRVEVRLADLEERLRRGELASPPPLPDEASAGARPAVDGSQASPIPAAAARSPSAETSRPDDVSHVGAATLSPTAVAATPGG